MKKLLLFDFGSELVIKIENILKRNNLDYQKVSYDFSCVNLDEYKGIIFSGSPDHLYDGGKICDISFLKNDLPKLGICYGHQLANYLLGGKVTLSSTPEFDVAKKFTISVDNPIFKGMNKTQNVGMYHYDEVSELAEGFMCLGYTDGCKNAAAYNEKLNFYTLQFHPEEDKYSDYIDEYYLNFNELCEKKND